MLDKLADLVGGKTMLRVLKEGGTVAVFPEGNRTYSGELCYISPAITKFFMMSKVPIVIYNIEGGYGVDPRWGLKKRKGKLCGKIKRVLYPDEYKTLTEEELHNLILNELNVKNAPSEVIEQTKARIDEINVLAGAIEDLIKSL